MYDPSAADEQTDIEQNPAELLRRMLPGNWEPGPVDWENRKGPMLAAMNKAVAGMPALQLDPVYCKDLKRALSGRWFYKRHKVLGVIKDKPDKSHPWSDYGDAFCYMLCAMGVNAGVDINQPVRFSTFFDPRLNEPDMVQELRVDPAWDARR
jgi:hypothetical protein